MSGDIPLFVFHNEALNGYSEVLCTWAKIFTDEFQLIAHRVEAWLYVGELLNHRNSTILLWDADIQMITAVLSN